MVPPEFGPGGTAQRQCDTRHIMHPVNNACTYVFRCLDMDFCFSLPEVQANKIDNICSIIHRWIHSTCTDPAIAQPHNNQGRCGEDYHHCILEELIKQPDNSFNPLRSIFAASEASMRFSAVLPMSGSAIACSSQPVPCSNSNSTSKDITNIPSVENTRIVDGSTIVEAAMSLGDFEWCQ